MSDKKLTVSEFAGKIKAKYPEYKDINDLELAQKIVAKYPEYESVVVFEEDSKKKEKSQEPFQFGVSDTPSAVQSEEPPKEDVDTKVEAALAFNDAFNPVGRALKKVPVLSELNSGIESMVGSAFKLGEMFVRENVLAYATANPAYAIAQNAINSAAPIDNKLADALGFMGDAFMESSSRAVRQKYKDYGIPDNEVELGIIGNLAEGNVSSAAKLTASTMVQQIPQLAVMAATGGTAGGVVLGATAAGGKYAEIQDDPTLSSQEKALYSLAIGAAEGIAENIFKTDVNQFRRIFSKKETTEAFKKEIKKQLKKETLWRSSREEATEEFLVAVTDNLIESGLKGNLENWDREAVLEIADNTLIGGLMGGGVYSVSRGVNAIGTTKNEREISRAKKDVVDLYAKLEDATDEQKPIIEELIEERLGFIIDNQSEDARFYKNFSDEDLKQVSELNKQIRKASKKYNLAASDSQKNVIKKELDELRGKKAEIENKYSESPTKYIKDGKEVPRAEFIDMLNQATPEDLATGQWGVQNDDEVEQLLMSKLPQDDRKEEERVPGTEQEGQAPIKEEPIQESSPEEAAPSGVVQETKQVTLSDGKTVQDGVQIVAKNPLTGDKIQGTIAIEGDPDNPRVTVETETDIVELGPANEINPSDITPFTEAVKEAETLTANEDGTLTYNKEGNPTIPKGTKLTVDADKGLLAVSVFSEGRFVPLTEDADREKGLRVQMRDQDGNEVQLYGQDALDATYNIMLALNTTQAEQLNNLLDNEKINAAIQEAEDSARKDTEATEAAERTAVEETGERGDPEYVTKKVSELPAEDISKLKKELSGQFALLTAENPMAKKLSEQENEALNKKAEAWLKKKGYSPRKISGRYKGIAENSFFVPGLTLEDAIAFAKEFNQDSVAHSEGMVYQDGSMNPRVKASDNFSFSEFNKGSNFVSVINTAEGPKTFQVGYNFDTKVTPEKKSDTQRLQSAESGSNKFGETFTKLIDNFNALLSKLGGDRVAVYVVDGETYKSVTGKTSRGTFTNVDGKKVIVVNSDKATLGTVYHEMMHAYIASMKLSPRQIVSFVNTIKSELKKGNATEKRLANQLEDFQNQYIQKEIYGKGLTLDDPDIAEEFAAEFVSQIRDNVDVDKMSLSTIDKIRLAIAKFINRIFKAGIDTSPIETRQEAFDFMNGFLDALEGRLDVVPSVNKTSNPHQAQRSKLQIDDKAPAGSKLFNTPLKEATDLAREYMSSKGLEYREGKPFNKLDEKRAKRISDAYVAMKNDPTNPEVAAAYKAMAEETIDQYEFITKAGYTVEMSNKEYDNSAQMIADLRDNKRMRIFSTESGFGDEAITAKQRKENPLLQKTKYKDVNGEPLLVNDVFRFVHDFFGHAKRGNSFGPKGEENAWDVHSRMYTPLARRAMTSETRGQNSFVNFSGENTEAFKLRDKARKLRREGKFAEAKDLTNKVYGMMTFAEQKVGLLPDEFVENPYDNAPALPSTEKGETVAKEQIDAVKIISLETPRKRAKKMAVAEVLNGFAESQLSPESSEQDLISRFLNNIFEESLYTLKKGPRESGMTWYIEDITEFENKMKVLLPELSDPNQMKLFKQVLAITSSGTNPNQNLQTAYTLWLRSNGNAVNFAKNWGEDKTSFITKDKKALGTGIIVRETKTKYIVQKVDALGNLETFKNGQPKLFEAKKSQLKEGYPKPAGFTSRGSIVAQQLEKIEQVYKDVDGDISKLVEFFEKPQPVSQLRKYNEKVPDVKGDTKKVAVGKRNGAFIFGEKIGAFYQNMIGIGDTITMDLWWSRTWNRYMGTMISVVKGKEEIQETPRTDRERDVMRKAVTLAAKKLNLDVSELQAVIWYFEQELWTKAGNVSPSFSYVTAVEALNSKIKTDEQTQKRFSEAGADLTAAEKRRQDAIVRANNIIAQGGIQGAVKEQIDFDAESKVDNEVFKALEKGEIPAPLYKKTWYQKLHSALFRTELETEVLKLQEKKEAQISDLEYQAREIANRIKKYAKTPEALKLANEYLTTEDKKDAVEAIKKLPAGQKLLDDLRVARAFIDNISEKFVKEPAFDGLPDDLRFAIQNNITTYLRTSYRFFTDKSYNIDKKRKPAIEGEFNRLVAQEIGLLGAMGMSKLDISNTINERRGEFVEEATQIIDSYISDLQDIKYQPSTAGVGIKMPNAPFRRKKDLPDYIKQLLGEDKNPVNRFAQTSKSLANVYYKNQMINGIIKLVGKNSDYILDEEPVGLKSKKYKKVNDPYSLLDGKWVHNDIIDMVDQKPLFTSENPWINGYYNVLKLGRKSKVIWNVTTWRKNLTGGWYFILANGIVNPTFYKDFTRRTKLMFSTTGEKFQVDDQTKTLMRIMAEKGVSGKSIDANMIGVSQAAMQFAIDGDENAYFARTKRIFNNIAQKDKWLQEKYAAVDDYTKLVIFRSEIESYAKKLYGKNYEQLNDSQKDKVHEEAAERVKQSTPTFSRLPKWYNKIAWIPIVGDFISFRLESLRSYGSNVANAVSDIKKSQEAGLDEVQRKEYLTAGLRRLAGSGAVFALKLAITKVLTQWFLDDDDEKLEEDVKNLRPDWMDGQSIIPRSIDKDGNVRVYNYSSEDPYGDVSDVFGGPESWGAMLQDFIRPNIAASLIFNLAQGEDIYGRNIADYSDSRLNNMLKIMSYTGKQIIVPPTVSSSFRDAWVKSELPVKDKAVNLATTIAERSLIRDYKYNVVDSFVQDLRKISGTRKTYVKYDDPTLRLKQLDDIKNQFNSIVAIGLAKRNYEMIDKAERLMISHLGDEDQDYVLDGILIKK